MRPGVGLMDVALHVIEAGLPPASRVEELDLKSLLHLTSSAE